MKAFGFFLNLLACFSLVFLAPEAQAKNYVFKNKITVEQAENALLSVFSSEEDQRTIKYEFVKVKKMSEKWLWRFELTDSGLAFRMNGKIQFVMEPLWSEKNTFLINGKKFKFEKGKSFVYHNQKLQKIINTTTAGLESLFIQDAEAGFFIPFLIAAVALGGIAYGMEQEKKVEEEHGKCTPRKNVRQTPTIAEINYWDYNDNCFNPWNRGSKPRKWPKGGAAKVKLVSKHFYHVCKGRQVNGYDCQSFGRGCKAGAGHRACAVKQCVTHKRKSVRSGGWNLTATAATQLCGAAYDNIQCVKPKPPATTGNPNCPIKQPDKGSFCSRFPQAGCCGSGKPVQPDLPPEFNAPPTVTGTCPKNGRQRTVDFIVNYQKNGTLPRGTTVRDVEACYLKAVNEGWISPGTADTPADSGS